MTDRGHEGVELSQEVVRCLSSVHLDFLILSILVPWVSQTLQILIVQKLGGARSSSDLWFSRGSWKSWWNSAVAGGGVMRWTEAVLRYHACQGTGLSRKPALGGPSPPLCCAHECPLRHLS